MINRAYFYNNPAISRDLMEEGEDRTAHHPTSSASGRHRPSCSTSGIRHREPPAHLRAARGFTAWRETLEEHAGHRPGALCPHGLG